MLSNMKKIMITGFLAIAAALCVSMPAAAENGRFTVFNESRYRINQMYVSPTGYNRWGYDRLGNNVLFPDYRFDLGVVPGWYDVKLVDQDGDTCVVPNVDIRYGETWTITDGILVACELFTR